MKIEYLYLSVAVGWIASVILFSGYILEIDKNEEKGEGENAEY